MHVQALRSKCGVPVPKLLSNELVKGFVDVSMQHRAAIAGTAVNTSIYHTSIFRTTAVLSLIQWAYTYAAC
jgi:hypothetical protein